MLCVCTNGSFWGYYHILSFLQQKGEESAHTGTCKYVCMYECMYECMYVCMYGSMSQSKPVTVTVTNYY